MHMPIRYSLLIIVTAIVAILGLFGLSMAFPAEAGAHLRFCGHYDKVYNYGRAKADFWYWSQNGGDHFHYYTHKTRVRLPNGTWSRWTARHTYYLRCNGVV